MAAACSVGERNEQLDVLFETTDRLGRAGITYMLTGSMALACYVEPRMTRDIDIVISATLRDGPRIARLFTEGFYVPEEALREALRGDGMASLLHLDTLFKVDLVGLRRDAFDQHAFGRARDLEIDGRVLRVIAPEDLFLAKLRWWRTSDSVQQRRDLSTLSRLPLDEAYLEGWAMRMGLGDALREVRGG
ncbi:MAG: hypothetical protein NW201_15240 [Gemmatimonadales bacterium]|nr:hypothetical protein [Gemmatimonadales bacterium]